MRRRGAAADVQGRPDDRGGCALRHAHPEVPTTRGDHRPDRVRSARRLFVARRLPAAGGLGDAAAQASVGASEPLGRGGAADQGSPAIVHLESWDRFSPMGGCRNASGRIHHEVSVFYRVPARAHARKAALACGPPARTHRASLHRATGPERSALAARVPGAQETLRSLPKAVEPTALGRSSPCRWSHSCWACARTTPPPHPRATGSPAALTVRRRTGGVRAHPEP